MRVIIRNSIRCNLCGDEIQSTHRHDFRACSCGESFVDGGYAYLRRLGSSWTDTSIVEDMDVVVDDLVSILRTRAAAIRNEMDDAHDDEPKGHAHD